jgi:hypothetical protein
MTGQQINRVSGKFIIVLSLTALLAVLSGYFEPPQPDEGTAAHIFQLSIVALVPLILTLPGHGRLAAAFAKRATISIFSRLFGCRVWIPVLP